MMLMRGIPFWRTAAALVCCAFIGGCISKLPTNTSGAGGTSMEQAAHSAAGARGTISIEGSSTVYPISQSIAEAFKAKHPAVEIDVGFSGTGGGFKKFIIREIDLCDASRAIDPGEIKACAENGVEYLELQVAVDALSVIVSPKNNWVDCISVAQLRSMWEPNSRVKKWSDVDPRWPAKELKLFGADADSGTFDYFTEAINGKAKQIRTEYSPNANDNIIVQGVADDQYALGFLGYSYYIENKDRLKALSIKTSDDAECVAPTPENVDADKYKPLARPLFLYVNKAALKRPEVAEFLTFYLSDEGQQVVADRKFIRVHSEVLQTMRQRLDDAIQGK